MRRKIQLAAVAAAMAAMTVSPAPASAAEICNAGDPLLQKVVCGTYYLVGDVLCKVSGGKNCMT
jgi:hypothetical protein